MASGSTATAAALKDYLRQYPNIKLYTPDAPDFDSVKLTFVLTPAEPLAIARPQSAEDVQALVHFCRQNDVDFVIRSGGHDGHARSQVHGALTIDVRDINYVDVDASKWSARVGGGASHRDLLRELEKHDLVTPVGSIASVGYVGWATLGGYGPFSGNIGLGVDQILGAKLVNASGDIVVADDELLKGIRGGGGIFGVIVELTVKVYPLREMVSALVVFGPSSVESSWQAFPAAYEGWLEEGLPLELSVQNMCLLLPPGPVFALNLAWTGPDHEEAHKWIDKVAALGQPIMKRVGALSAFAFVEQNEKVVKYGLHGRAYSVNIRQVTPKTAAILAKYNATLPGSDTSISVNPLRSPRQNDGSVFGSRTEHLMLLIPALASDEESSKKSTTWAQALVKELREGDPDNILEDSYVTQQDNDSDFEKIYGKHYPTLVALKKKYDPENIFKHAVPKLIQ